VKKILKEVREKLGVKMWIGLNLLGLANKVLEILFR
jgi:hypothetical protein